ncbi:MAG: aromatic hydrocarbon degradation protein [Epsilonproteobacteria bacterium]|nr:aromatic hydrocarbon degradation protein [Campylobacterota bacterium]
MKKELSFILALSTGVYATNGDILIGVGAKTRGMGGAGIAFSHGAESTLTNPALITKVPQTQISFGGTIFMPTIKSDIGPTGNPKESDADISVIPEVSIASKIGSRVYLGVGMWGTAGMGTDFRDESSLMNMETTLQLMQFAVPLAYKVNGFSIGVAPILQYGSLDIYYQHPNPQIGVVSSGQSQDFGVGVSIGATYDFHNGLMVGAVYKSKIEMEYDRVLTTATAPFQAIPNFPAISDILEQPAEAGVGVSYSFGAHSIAVDFKRIFWSDAKGYREFGWDDQDVYAVGYQYSASNWDIRVGFNHGSNPVTIFDGATDMAAAALNMFNLLGFPATAKNHITFGGTYRANSNFSTDIALVYALNSKTSADISALGIAQEIKNEHKEFGVTIQFNYNF